MEKILIIEGAQGVGKSTVTTMLREQIPYSNLYRLSGIQDKSEKGKDKLFGHFVSLIQYLETDAKINAGFTHIFDRFFTTEYCYSRCGYTGNDFSNSAKFLTNMLYQLTKNAEVYFILLVSSETKLTANLESHANKPLHAGINFTVTNSIRQQDEFINVYNELFKDDSIKSKIIDSTELSAQQTVDLVKEFCQCQ